MRVGKLWTAAMLLAASGLGCASQARYVSKQGDSGVIAIPANTNAWPGYNRNKALELVKQHVGPDYVILEEREVATGSVTTNNQHTKTEKTFNGSFPFLPAEKQMTTNTATTRDLTEYHIAYKKAGGTNPASGGIQQVQFNPNTSSSSAVVPAGGAPLPGGTSLPPGAVPGVTVPGVMRTAGGLNAGPCTTCK